MITFEQCKHVIHYYVLKMTTTDHIQVSPHIQRDCIYLNKMRGEICANVMNNPLLKAILLLIHDASTIEQVNSIPINNKCFIDNKNIPKSTSGIQLIIHIDDKKEHICIQKKYQKICYSYFKLRNFDQFIESYIKKWLSDQEWYIPKMYTSDYVVNKIVNSQIPKAIHTQWIEITDILTE